MADFLGGTEAVIGDGAGALRCWQITCPLAVAARQDARFAALGSAFVSPLRWSWLAADPVLIDPASAMILDIETGGFAGTPVFLIGLVRLGRAPLETIQFLARDYPEEPALLHALAGIGATCATWITFNGRSFDEPFLRDRAAVHRIPLPAPRLHVDLLHAARASWRDILPDCRLRTLEQRILGRTRFGDIPGREVPELFHLFYRTGNPAPLGPVLEHNRLDLVTATELLLRLATA